MNSIYSVTDIINRIAYLKANPNTVGTTGSGNFLVYESVRDAKLMFERLRSFDVDCYRQGAVIVFNL